MICGFKQKFPWGDPTYFREKILAGVGYINIHSKAATSVGVIEDNIPLYSPEAVMSYLFNTKTRHKLHTIREGNRWKAGDKIHMAYGVRTKNYQQFNKGIPELEVVKSVQRISITYLTDEEREQARGTTYYNPIIKIDGRMIDIGKLSRLASNDGFYHPIDNIHNFLKWFNKDFEGQIIHWTDLKY